MPAGADARAMDEARAGGETRAGDAPIAARADTTCASDMARTSTRTATRFARRPVRLAVAGVAAPSPRSLRSRNHKIDHGGSLESQKTWSEGPPVDVPAAEAPEQPEKKQPACCVIM